MKNLLALLTILACNLFVNAQNQTIRGRVIDQDTQQPLIGATVEVLGLESSLGTITDFDGRFALENIPLGRQQIECNYVGYSTFQSDHLILNAARELVLNIALIETGVTTEEVVVKAYKKGNQPINDAAVLSTRSFSVEETQRYAASANDPGRMAQAFPGVQPSRDNRSDIVIRGNSSVGLLWRLEGVDIPNPNHFARRGSSGGGITIFSISMLANSDFSTGAFSAEYGNAFSGVFDMKFRKGNRTTREYTFRAGMLGLDFSTEGPIQKGKSSYLVNYRYSTLGILNSMDIHLVGERVNNTFQDLSFNLHFPSKNNKSIIGLWAIGGLSSEIGSTIKDKSQWKSYSDRTAYDFITNMGAIGLNHTYLINDKSYIKTTIAAMGQEINVADDTLSLAQERTNINTETYINARYTLTSFYSQKFHPKLTLKTGVSIHNLQYNLQQDSLTISNSQTKTILDAKGFSFLIQPYAQLKYRPYTRWAINVGIHALHFMLNSTSSVEPRLGIQYQMNERQSISFAYGLHGRMLPLGSYFTQIDNGDGTILNPNKDLKLIKSHHLVLGYKHSFRDNLRFQIESYYQYLYHVPIVDNRNRTYWMLNDIQGYASEELVSKGTGTNIGIDISLEKYFSDDTYFILTGSVYDSKYKALDKSKSFNTQYNSNYSVAFMGGKEFKIGKNGVLQTALKLIYNGGLRITPLQENPSTIKEYQAPENEALAFSEQIPAYFRPDLRLAFRKDATKYSWSLALDIQNVIARQNIDGLNRVYDSELKNWVYRKQASLVPVLSYQIDF